MTAKKITAPRQRSLSHGDSYWEGHRGQKFERCPWCGVNRTSHKPRPFEERTPCMGCKSIIHAPTDPELVTSMMSMARVRNDVDNTPPKVEQ